MTKMADRQNAVVICILLAGICYISFALECIPADGYQSCACYMEGVNNTREYINLLPLKRNSPNPRHVVLILDLLNNNYQVVA